MTLTLTVLLISSSDHLRLSNKVGVRDRVMDKVRVGDKVRIRVGLRIRLGLEIRLGNLGIRLGLG